VPERISPTATGQIGVARAVEQFLQAGFCVATPMLDEGYDLLVGADGRWWRVQVKATSSVTGGVRRNRIDVSRTRGRSLYTTDIVDAIVAVHLRTGLIMCVPMAVASGRRYLNWSMAAQWSDFGKLRSVKAHK
jgi:hypothetical protein